MTTLAAVSDRLLASQSAPKTDYKRILHPYDNGEVLMLMKFHSIWVFSWEFWGILLLLMKVKLDGCIKKQVLGLIQKLRQLIKTAFPYICKCNLPENDIQQSFWFNYLQKRKCKRWKWINRVICFFIGFLLSDHWKMTIYFLVSL